MLEKFAHAAKSAVKKREEEQQFKWVLNKSIREKSTQKNYSFFGRKNHEGRRGSSCERYHKTLSIASIRPLFGL